MAKKHQEYPSVWTMIKMSCKDHLLKFSATRINGYWMSVLFTLCVLCCVGVEITSAITQYNKSEPLSISNQLIAMAVLILGQQAIYFNAKKKSEETPFPTVEKLNSIIHTEKGTIPNVSLDEEPEATPEPEADPITVDNMGMDMNMDAEADAGTNGII
jgi:hypothetical protein